MIRLIFEEVIGEMATVCKDAENNVGIGVYPDSGRIGNPYFKFYNSTNYDKATKVVRITFNQVDYIVHKNNNGADLWKLNHKDKKLLMKLLKRPSKTRKDLDNWTLLKYHWNDESLPDEFDLDDYVSGMYDEQYSDNTNYVASYIDIPDYMGLDVK